MVAVGTDSIAEIGARTRLPFPGSHSVSEQVRGHRVGFPRQVRRVVLAYLAIATVWIVLSTPAGNALARNTRLDVITIEIIKGVVFVAVTAALLAVVLTRSSRSLIESESRFHTLADAVPEGLYVQRLRPTRRYEFVNPALVVTTGVPATSWYGDPDVSRRHVHPDDLPTVEAAQTDPTSIEWPITFRWRRPDGHWRSLEVSETPVRDASGSVVAVQGVAVDVTRREEREAALASALDQQRRAAEELERLQDMQRAFLQAVSHDLRTPLTVILGLAEVLERRGDALDAEQQARLRTRLTENAHRLSDLLTDLLDIDRLTRGVIEPQRRPIDVAALARQTVAQLDTDSHELRLPHGVVRAEVDPAQTARIIENLVANALKHTPPGTSIEVSCEEVADGIELVVQDTGPGVADDESGRIFEPFVRGDDPDPSPGSGIGLALVRQFAQLHGGDARLENADGGGSRFVVHLPSRSPASSRSTQA